MTDRNGSPASSPRRRGKVPPRSWEEVVVLTRLLREHYNRREQAMTPQELIAHIEMLRAHAREVSSALSEAYGEFPDDDRESLRLDEAERIVTGLQHQLGEAREKVVAFLGAQVLARQLEKPGAVADLATVPEHRDG